MATTCFPGKGVTKAVGAVNGPDRSAILAKTLKTSAGIDKNHDRPDGTENKSNFGASFHSGVSFRLTPKLLLPLKVRCTSTLLNFESGTRANTPCRFR